MKITTTLEVSKEEKNLIHSALTTYVEHLTKMLSDSPESGCKTFINTTLTNANRLLSEMELSL